MWLILASYKAEMNHFHNWCSDSSLILNKSKTLMITDLRRNTDEDFLRKVSMSQPGGSVCPHLSLNAITQFFFQLFLAEFPRLTKQSNNL